MAEQEQSMPPQKQDRQPGRETEMNPRPQFEPRFKGSGKLEGKVAIVTGGDSGIGRAVAVLFAREGADVAVMHLEHEQADAEVVRAAVEREGRRAITIAGDVTDRAFCFVAVERVARELGGVDVLVNNAAFQLHVSRFEDL